MQIEVTNGVFWDTATPAQSESAMTWLTDTVRPNLSESTRDAHGRPVSRTWTDGTVTVTETQCYINNHTWARSGVTYVVAKNDAQ